MHVRAGSPTDQTVSAAGMCLMKPRDGLFYRGRALREGHKLHLGSIDHDPLAREGYADLAVPADDSSNPIVYLVLGKIHPRRPAHPLFPLS